MEPTFIGRAREKVILEEALQSNEAEMVAVIGRRRVGKTFLVQSVYKEQLVFEITGLQNASKKEQLENFSLQLKEAYNSPLSLQKPSTWLEAFSQLITYLKQLPPKEKQVVFFDELPWLAHINRAFSMA